MSNNLTFATARKGNSIRFAESAERAGLLGRLVKANGELIPEQQAERSTASHYALRKSTVTGNAILECRSGLPYGERVRACKREFRWYREGAAFVLIFRTKAFLILWFPLLRDRRR